MAKKGKKKLSKEEVVEIAGKRIFFEEKIHILDGKIAEGNSKDGFFVFEEEEFDGNLVEKIMEKDEEPFYQIIKDKRKVEKVKGKYLIKTKVDVFEENVVEIKYNENVNDRIKKYVSEILGMRGIKSLDAIGTSDPDVKKLYKDWEKRIGRRFIDREEKRRQRSRFIEQVRREHEPHYTLALFQLMSWAVIYESVFKIMSDGNIDCSIEDIEVPEEYWDSDLKSNNADADLDRILNGYKATKVVFDNTNPLEIMLAITTQIFEKYEEFGKKISSYMENIYAGMQVLNTNRDFDDAGFLNTVLDDILSGELEETDDSE